MVPSSFVSLLFPFLFFTASAGQSSPAPARFPWIQRFASIGDSYAAGLGAGPRVDFVCSRYGHSYPNLLHTAVLGDDTNRTHQFLACSGATSTEILEKQVPVLGDNLDLLTISAGGNDIGLTPILNNCVYQFYMASEEDCKDAIASARGRIADDTELYNNITKLINASKPKMNETHGSIYVTGYAGFFGVDDNTCDNVTWAVWRDVKSEGQYLKLGMRKDLNKMVRAVNDVLWRVVEDSGPSVHFIDYDKHIEQGRGRYCESGIHEPAPNRLGLAFYEWDTIDTDDNETALRRTGDDVPKGSFEGQIAELINKTLQEHPGWEFDPDKGFVNKSKMHVRPEGVVDDTVWWLLPDSWKRVFHLRPEAHAIIAQLVVRDLESRSQRRRDGIHLLIWIAAVGLSVMVGLLVLLMAMIRRKKPSWPPAWLRGRSKEEIFRDGADEEADADPAGNVAPTIKQYNTFN